MPPNILQSWFFAWNVACAIEHLFILTAHAVNIENIKSALEIMTTEKNCLEAE